MLVTTSLPTDVTDLQHEVQRLNSMLQEAQSRIAALHVVQVVAQSLSTERQVEPLLNKIMASAVEVMTASAGSLLLVDALTQELVFTVTEGGGGNKLLGLRLKLGQGIAGWVATHREPLIVSDVNKDSRYYQSVAQAVDFHISSILCVPMISKNRLIGVLQLLHQEKGRYFSRLDQQLLTTFASQSAVAIENAQLHQSLINERDRLIEAEDDIRKRLARDLHDGPTQLVSAIMMNINFVRELFKRDVIERVDGELDHMHELAERSVKQLRTLLFDLRPVILETQGLLPALEVYADRLNEVEPFRTQIIVQETFDRLSPKAETSIFAIIQEAINNAKKYAEAACVQVVFRPSFLQDELTVVIRDNGVGFDLHKMQGRYDERGSLGMVNSQERAKAVNGVFSIRSEIGRGTDVFLRLPLLENLLTHQKRE